MLCFPEISSKCGSEFADPDPVQYFLPIGDTELQMNALIGKTISLKFTGQINCISCGKRTKTSFGQGFCYNCLQTAPEGQRNGDASRIVESALGHCPRYGMGS